MWCLPQQVSEIVPSSGSENGLFPVLVRAGELAHVFK